MKDECNTRFSSVASGWNRIVHEAFVECSSCERNFNIWRNRGARKDFGERQTLELEAFEGKQLMRIILVFNFEFRFRLNFLIIQSQFRQNDLEKLYRKYDNKLRLGYLSMFIIILVSISIVHLIVAAVLANSIVSFFIYYKIIKLYELIKKHTHFFFRNIMS